MTLWTCPSCKAFRYSSNGRTPLHVCGGLEGTRAHLVPEGTKARHVIVPSEDYAADIDRVAAVRTDYPDGSNSVVVLPPVARGFGQALKGGIGVQIMPGIARARAQGHFHHRYHDPELARMARMAFDLDARMAWSTSNWNCYYIYAIGTNTGKPSTDAFYAALFGNGVTPAQSTTAALTQYAGASSTWSTSNEVSGTGYTAGGYTGGTYSWAQSSNVLTFSSSSTPQWTGASFSAYGVFVYDHTSNAQGITWNYFGGIQTVTDNTFSISWNASGIGTITC
jgi:hypothetical protein